MTDDQNESRSSLRVLDLGRRDYRSVYELQEKTVEERRKGLVPDTLYLVEHDPVYTLGTNADDNNIIASEEQLKKLGIDVVQSSRGGDVTYHGPGQIVGYPIIDLGKERSKVLWYVKSLEDTIIMTLAHYGVKGETDKKNRGVWVGRDKIAAIGVRVTRSVTMHGFALNVCADIDHYSGIIACGIRDRGVTSLDRLVADVKIDDVKEKLIESFKKVFSYDRS
jgi:lipoyl(octanoyl) transferase